MKKNYELLIILFTAGIVPISWGSGFGTSALAQFVDLAAESLQFFAKLHDQPHHLFAFLVAGLHDVP